MKADCPECADQTKMTLYCAKHGLLKGVAYALYNLEHPPMGADGEFVYRMAFETLRRFIKLYEEGRLP